MNSLCPFTRILRRFSWRRLFRRTGGRTVPHLPLAPKSDDPDRARATRAFLEDVQGGIVSGSARGSEVALWFFTFAEPAAHARNARAMNAAADCVTTAWDQYEQRVRGGFRSLALSGPGLRACGIDERQRDGTGFCPPDLLRWLLDGMSQPGELVWNHDTNNPGELPADWEPEFLQRIDGAWLLGARSPAALDTLLQKVVAWGAQHGLAEVKVERMRVRRDAAGRVREPFGFVDGISSQNFFRIEPHALRTPLDKVFLTTPRHFGGSFLVVRKLEQNVKAFRAFRQQQIDQLGPDAGERKASEIIGRLPDGTPLAPRSASSSLNDFDFANDPSGARCPFFAHIRRANPRAVQDGGATPTHLVRRGVTYGSDADFARPEGAATGVGLMFMAYMSDLDAFRTIQGSWFAHQDFPVAQPRPPVSADALIFGPLATMGQDPPARWVTPKGGGYFFVPSCSWLRELEPEIA